MQLLAVMEVMRAVKTVTTMSKILFSVFFVDSFIRLTPDPSLNREGRVYLGGFGF